MHRVDFFSLSVLLCGLHGGWFFFGVLCRRDQVLLIRSLSFICIHNRLLSSAATVKLIFSLSLSLSPSSPCIHFFMFLSCPVSNNVTRFSNCTIPKQIYIPFSPGFPLFFLTSLSLSILCHFFFFLDALFFRFFCSRFVVVADSISS